MGYRKLTEVDQVTPGTMAKFSIDPHMILLVNVNGAFYALDNKCPHLGGDLSGGKLDGETITCPRHGAQFDVRTGNNLAGAKIAFVNMKVGNAKSYPVRVEGHDVLVNLP
ncbi:MAG: Rieske 2Fe-2S domain-containing protein [Eubacteriales bacterium]